jgi:hypothetical protein
MSTLKKSLQTLGSIAAIGGLVAATPLSASAQASNPCAPKAGKAMNPCAPKAKKASNPCAPSAKKAANPCAAKK